MRVFEGVSGAKDVEALKGLVSESLYTRLNSGSLAHIWDRFEWSWAKDVRDPHVVRISGDLAYVRYVSEVHGPKPLLKNPKDDDKLPVIGMCVLEKQAGRWVVIRLCILGDR